MAEKNIDGGATIWARQTIDSDIFYWKPDKWFKMWFVLVNRVNHADTKLFKRGTGFITHKEIAEKTRGSMNQVNEFIRWAKKAKMCTTQKTTRGMIVTINNYELYQDFNSYKNNTKPKIKTRHTQHTHKTISNNDNNEKNGNGVDLEPLGIFDYYVGFEMAWKIYPKEGKGNREQALKKFKDMITSAAELTELLQAIENYKQSRKVKDGFVKDFTNWIIDWNDWKPEKPKKVTTHKEAFGY